MRLLILIIGLIFSASALSWGSPHSIVSGTSNLNSDINLAVRSLSPNANIGITIKSMKYGDILYTRNSQSLFVPASTLKIFTAQAALLYLGPNFKFKTRFVTDARSINNGTLYGNLYLVHSGDPSLTYYDLAELVVALKSQHIEKIAGNVYIDNSAYDQVNFGPGWMWNDRRFCYAAPISASIINHNCSLTSIVRPGRRFGHFQGISSSVSNNVIQYDKSLLQDLFRRYGVQVYGNIAAGTAEQAYPALATHQSKPLSQLINSMLKKSDNIIAGSLFKKIGQIYTNRPGSWENGGTAVAKILSQAGIDTWRMNVIDGSGLSRYNKVTPAQMMQLLDFAYHHSGTNYEFVSALPIAGIDGTLKRRLQNIAWRVRAKTGTISGVRALAGFAVTSDKEPVAFVIMINGHSGASWRYKVLEDRIVTMLTHYSRRG